jgi:hypothetical protein
MPSTIYELLDKAWEALMRFKSLALLVALCVMLSGCGGVITARTTPAPSPSQIIRVHIVRTSGIPRQNLPPIDKLIGDSSVAQRLYDATTALPQFPMGVFACPSDYNVAYALDFTRGDGRSVQISADPYGCWIVSIGANNKRKASDRYWSLLAQTLQITRAELQPDSIYPIGPS